MKTDFSPDTNNEDIPLPDFLTYRISKVQAKLNAQASAILSKYAGLTLSQWRVLALVGDAGETRMSDVARGAALDKGLVSRNLKVLVEKGLILTRQDHEDHRIQHLCLTAEGVEVFHTTLPKMRLRQNHLKSAVPPTELEALYSALEKLEQAADWRGGE